MAYKHIGVAISGNEEDALLVNKALELARHNDAHLTLIHIDDGLSELYPGIYFPATEDILQLLKNKSDNKLYKLTKNIQWPKTKLRIERGEMPETLLENYGKRAVRPPCARGHHHSFINRLMPAYRGMINKMMRIFWLIVPFIDK
ncbi:universal stress protein UspD [Escherichia coli]